MSTAGTQPSAPAAGAAGAAAGAAVGAHAQGECNPCVFFFSDYGCPKGRGDWGVKNEKVAYYFEMGRT